MTDLRIAIQRLTHSSWRP